MALKEGQLTEFSSVVAFETPSVTGINILSISDTVH